MRRDSPAAVGRDVLKFSQLPMDGTTIPNSDGTVGVFFGHDEVSTAYSVQGANGTIGYSGQFMADDFADRFDTPVVHVKWWGSYLKNEIHQPVDKFLISFESDVPQGPLTTFSHPGQPLLNQVVFLDGDGALSPGEGTYTEKRISPGGPPLDEGLYEYNAELYFDKPFPQDPNTVYWLKIVALVDLPAGFDPTTDPATEWGWHNRDYTVPNPLASVPPAVIPGEHIDGVVGAGIDVWHFQDDAVTGGVFVETTVPPGGLIMPIVIQDQASFQPTHYLDGIDGPDGMMDQLSKDLAFELYTVVPEPASGLLLGVGMLGMLLIRRRRRAS